MFMILKRVRRLVVLMIVTASSFSKLVASAAVTLSGVPSLAYQGPTIGSTPTVNQVFHRRTNAIDRLVTFISKLNTRTNKYQKIDGAPKIPAKFKNVRSDKIFSMGQFVKWYQEVHADASRDAAEKDRYIFSALASNVKAPYLYASITTAIRNNDEIGLAFERLLFEDWVRSIGRGNFMKNEKVLQYLQHDHDSLDGQKMTRLQLTLDKENHFLFDDFMKLKSTVYLKRSYYQPLLANFKANHDGKVDNKYPNLRHSQTFDIDALTNLDELDRAVTDFKADFGRYLLSKLRIIANDKDISELLQELADTNLMSDSLRKVKAALIASKTSAQPKH